MSEDLLDRLKAASNGDSVWRIMTPDGKSYIDEMGYDISGMPEKVMRDWLAYQQRKGNYSGYYVQLTTRYDSKDRLIREAISEIVRLRKLEQGYQESIQMRTRDYGDS